MILSEEAKPIPLIYDGININTLKERIEWATNKPEKIIKKKV